MSGQDGELVAEASVEAAEETSDATDLFDPADVETFEYDAADPMGPDTFLVDAMNLAQESAREHRRGAAIVGTELEKSLNERCRKLTDALLGALARVG